MKKGRKSKPRRPKVIKGKGGTRSELFIKLEAALNDAIQLKKSKNYLDRDFDSLVDSL